MRNGLLYSLLIALALLSLILALSSGSLNIGVEQAWQALWGEGDPLQQRVVQELRLPRALAAFAVGGLLTLAGALMQVLLRNPLADPYVLGVSGGAAVAALLAMLAGLGGVLLQGSAFVGAMLATLLVFGLAHGKGQWTTSRLLLTGVVLAAGWGAVISFLLAIAPTNQLPGMLFWLMGDLSPANNPFWALTLLAFGILIALPMGRSLNILSRGELQAQALGVEQAKLRYAIYLLASLYTATAVTLAGSIGFVGLVVPHLTRLLLGGDNRRLLPAAALLGGSLLVLADTLARTIIAPQQLPVGVLTALIGVPLFLILLQRSRIHG
ncbi:MAG: iron ABC transporter permease [Gammaproteobacteria bacterium]|nr:iron ABC transporter permease [Gammaproteobacteria bacterium]